MGKFWGIDNPPMRPCKRPPILYKACTWSVQKASQLFLNDQNRSTHFRLMWAKRKTRSVGRAHTNSRFYRPLTTAPWMSPKGNSRDTWHVTLQTFFSVAHHFGARDRNMLQWPPDNYNSVAWTSRETSDSNSIITHTHLDSTTQLLQ